jgi:hypothetical protein
VPDVGQDGHALAWATGELQPREPGDDVAVTKRDQVSVVVALEVGDPRMPTAAIGLEYNPPRLDQPVDTLA